MPTKDMELQSGILHFVNPETSEIIGKLSDIEKVEVAVPEVGVDAPTFNREDVFTFDNPIQVTGLATELSRDDLILFLFYGIDAAKLLCNNWRKMHGLPTKRRRRDNNAQEKDTQVKQRILRNGRVWS